MPLRVCGATERYTGRTIMGELTTGHVLLDAVLIVVMMLVLDWVEVESKRNRSARTRPDSRERLGAGPLKKAA